MPYKKRYKGKRSAPLSHRQVKAVSKIANKQIHKMSELKTLDEAPVDKVSSTTAYTVDKLVTPPVVGTGQDNRLGGSIYLKSVTCRAIADCATANATSMRVIVFQWLESDNATGSPAPGRAPVAGDILEFTGSGGGLTSFYKKNPQNKFKILNDQLLHWDSNAQNAPKTWGVKISAGMMGRRKPDFDGAATSNGNFYIMYISDNGGKLAHLSIRTRFYDN